LKLKFVNEIPNQTIRPAQENRQVNGWSVIDQLRRKNMKWTTISLADETFSEKYAKNGVIERDQVLKPATLVPYQVYSVLKTRFGASNSSMFDDLKCQWQYSLQCADAYFEVYDWKMSGWSIAVYLKEGARKDAKEISLELLRLLEKEALRVAGKVKEKAKEPKGCVIENPYLMYRLTADSLLVLLNEMKEPDKEPQITFNRWMQHYDVCRAALLMYLSSVEAFVNLLYELYLRDELREKRIYERISREQIDLKIRLAPAYCECFKRGAIDAEAEVFKQFMSLVNLRNDFVHANLTKPMMSPIVQEDGIDFMLPHDASTSIGIPNHFGALESNDVETASDITLNLIDHIVDQMRPTYRKEMRYLMQWEHVEVTYENGRLRVANR
jgi:hypothetical protein